MSAKSTLDVPCPDCGAGIAVPFSTNLVDGAITVEVDLDGSVECMTAHVDLNPDIHPTFTYLDAKDEAHTHVDYNLCTGTDELCVERNERVQSGQCGEEWCEECA